MPKSLYWTREKVLTVSEKKIVELVVRAKHNVLNIRKGDELYFPMIREDMIHLILDETWEIVEAKPREAVPSNNNRQR